jgi:hypothetical protein
VLLFGRSLSALLLALALSLGDPALCVGLMAQPDPPMACCADGQPCPMHAPDAEAAGSAHHRPERAPDDCCLLSGQPGAVPVASTTAVSAPHGVVSAVDSRRVDPVRAHAGPAHALEWSPGPHVPRHVLLSVFLV